MDAYERQEFAVWGKTLKKSYGSRKKKVEVLQNLDITVQRGCMYVIFTVHFKTFHKECIILYQNDTARYYFDRR